MMTARSAFALLSTAALLLPALASAANEAGPDDEAPDDGANGVLRALENAAAETKPLFDIRLRYEGTDQDGFDDRANALTYRIRAGVETGAFFSTKFLIDFDHIEPITNDFNSTTNGRTEFPVVTDPETTELNRIQITNTSVKDTTVTLGRQRVNFDDQRFVGSVGWRQNEQTLDAVRVETALIGPITANVIYSSQVNRIFGEGSPMGRFDGDSYLVNLAADTPIGKAVGFAYLVDIDEVGALASQTYGGRLSGSADLGPLSLAYLGSYAHQSDFASNDLSFQTEFYTAALTATANGVSGGVAYEALGDDDAAAFQTPLATLHKFNGWADLFLTTPPEGLADLNGSVGYAFGDLGPFKNVKTKVIYHDFGSYTGSIDYGSEIDAIATAKLLKLSLLLKFADYTADEFAGDKQVVWFQIGYRL